MKPTEIPQPPEGFEYIGTGPIIGCSPTMRNRDTLHYWKGPGLTGEWRGYGFGDREDTHYALCIGSEIHALNFPKPEPAKAREWNIRLDTTLGWRVEGPDGKPLETITVREVLPVRLPASELITENLKCPACPPHYAGPVTPWDLQRCMKSSGSAFVDARRTDAIEYAFRTKGDLLGDLKKGRHCLDEAIKELEKKGAGRE